MQELGCPWVLRPLRSEYFQKVIRKVGQEALLGVDSEDVLMRPQDEGHSVPKAGKPPFL